MTSYSDRPEIYHINLQPETIQEHTHQFTTKRTPLDEKIGPNSDATRRLFTWGNLGSTCAELFDPVRERGQLPGWTYYQLQPASQKRQDRKQIMAENGSIRKVFIVMRWRKSPGNKHHWTFGHYSSDSIRRNPLTARKSSSLRKPCPWLS